MHPAYSVIFFTTASGAGYGLLILLAATGALGLVQPERWLGFSGYAAALALITTGLLASSAHLGRPERAWRAFSQWRSSWLSREGILAVATYVPAGVAAIGWVFFETTHGMWNLMAWLAVICALLTVYCTSQIYASLRTIRQWHHPLVPPLYLLLALATGAVCLNLLLKGFGVTAPWAAWLAVAALVAGGTMKFAYWRGIDRDPGQYTVGSATGLGRYGTVRPLDPAHAGKNFIMREMGYKVGRKHAQSLRRLALISGFVLPSALCLISIFASDPIALACAIIALILTAIGILIERWLFFAEAEHVVNLFYGAQRA